MTIDGRGTTAVYYDSRQFKITNLNSTYGMGLVTGAAICFTLVAPCASLPTLCGGSVCQAAIFNDGLHNCCPLTQLGV